MSKLSQNTTDLQTILDKVNALPEAGSGTADPVLQSKSVTPTTSEQTVTPDTGYDGLSDVTVSAIPDEYVITTDATATADEIFKGETAYVNGSKVTGTFTIESELTDVESKLAKLSTILEDKTTGSGNTGGAIETCTGVVSRTSYTMRTMCYTDENLTAVTCDATGSITVPKGSLLLLIGASTNFVGATNAHKVWPTDDLDPYEYEYVLLQIDNDNFEISYE